MRSTPDKATDFEKTSKPAPGPEHRRSFVIKAIALACGAIATLSPFAAGVWTYLDPLRPAEQGFDVHPCCQPWEHSR